MKNSDKIHIAQIVLVVLGIGGLTMPPLIFGRQWEQWTEFAQQLHVFALYVLPPVAAGGIVAARDAFFVKPRSWPKIISLFISLAGVIYFIGWVAIFTDAL